MIFWIASKISKLFGLDISKVQRYVFWAVVVIGLLFVLILVLSVRSCFNKPPKLNEAEIQKGEQAVKDRNDKVLKEILTNSDVQEAKINANISNSEADTVNAIKEAKEKYANMNTSDLAAELERRK